MKKIGLLILGLLVLSTLALANSEHNHETEIEEGKKLVESGISCDKLSDEQLEAIGEYLMEQMHPGEAHEAMHEMMGMEEGTEYHKQVHVNMARMMYCGESTMMGGGMMGSGGMMGMMPMMMNMMGSGMMGSGGMMGSNMMSGQAAGQTNLMQGMEGSGMMQSMTGNNAFGFGTPFLGYGYWSIWNALFIVLLIGAIALVFLGVFKLWKDVNKKQVP